ncbi:MAG: alkaline phosphatase family protein, partial [Verrucomicrobia bacterium]|nr:alkaline phosphatase family protein [Verrucomicrobiota bacterium]
QGAIIPISPAFPALTCTAQSNYLTGKTPSQHGIVGNGWFNRELAEVQFWKQSNRLVQQPKIWDALAARQSSFTVANCFWWFNMYSSVDYAITPRPIYCADGRKILDIYTWPFSLRAQIKNDLGEFPFFGFWGPAAGISTSHGAADCASGWIAAAARWMEYRFSPTLNLVYLPHLDYNLQRHGPRLPDGSIHPAVIPDLRAVDSIVGDLIDFFSERGVAVVLLSEYGIANVDLPVHLNRIFRQQGWLALKDELGREILDAGASRVFAVADHQIAHVYVNDPPLARAVRNVLEQTPGIEQTMGEAEKIRANIAHPRAGDFIVAAAPNAWFTYYYWEDDRRAPDFARTVDIHRKPGYDPAELFLDPRLPAPRLKIGWRLLQKKLGFRTLMDVVALDAGLVKGSHGRVPADKNQWPILTTSRPDLLQAPTSGFLDSTGVFDLLLRHLI